MNSGFSHVLAQIALGHSQSSVIANAHFENEVLKLYEIMIPPIMSSTMNADGLAQLSGKGTKDQSTNSNSQVKSEGTASGKAMKTEEKSAGRPAKPDDQKSDKTI